MTNDNFLIPSETIERKFLESISIDDWEIETDTGWEEVTSSHLTVPYSVWEIKTVSGKILQCADNHIIFDEHYNEVFVKDLGAGDKIQTKDGIESLLSVRRLDREENMYDFSVNSPNHRYYTNDILSHNTTCSAAAMVHYAIFNQDKTIAILANKADQAREILHRIQLMFENIPAWMKPGVIEWNKGSVEFDNGTRILTSATSGSGIRGRSVSWLYMDEYAFVPINEQEEFFASTYPTISSGKTTKVTITSTPNGMDMFYRMWMDAIEGRSDFKHMTIHWSDVPGRDEKWYEETIRNIGEEKFKVEYGGEFSGATGTLISGSKLKQLRQSTPINTWNNVRFYDEPHEGHQYVMTVDCSQGVGGDSSAFSVIDVTSVPYVQVATFYDNNISPLMFPDVIVSVAKMFNNAYVLCEVNDIGHKVAYIIQAELEYEYLLTCSTKGRNGQCVSGGFGANTFLGVKTTSAVKKIGCSTLKKMIESDKLIIKDSHTITELFSFISYPNGTYAAEKGQHDDSVMTLVIFSWLSLDDFYKEVTNQDVRKNMLQDIDSSEDMPFGFFNDGETIIDISPASRVNTFGDEIFRF